MNIGYSYSWRTSYYPIIDMMIHIIEALDMFSESGMCKVLLCKIQILGITILIKITKNKILQSAQKMVNLQ